MLPVLPFSLPGFLVDTVHTGETTLIVEAHAVRPSAQCPRCQQSATRIHSRYMRSPHDLPVSEQRVQLRLHVRRCFCDHPTCPQRTFAERLPDLVPVRAHRTVRLTHALQVLGFALGGRAGTPVAAALHMPVSRQTLLRVVRATSPAPATTPRVLGVDDFALRKGRVYGTLLVDLERRCPVDLLPDRSAATLALWLRSHAGVEIIARDRSTEYARGANDGAPHARHVVDRWPVLVNLREALERLLNRVHGRMCSLPASAVLTDLLTTRKQQVARPLRQPSPKAVLARQARRARRYDRYEQARALHAQGVPIRHIAHRLAISWTTARNFAYAETFPERAQAKPRSSQLDGYVPYLLQRWADGCTNASQLWRELQAQGYGGTRKQVARWVQQQRIVPAPATPTKALRSYAGTGDSPTSNVGTPMTVTLPSPRELVWVLLRDPQQLEVTDRAMLDHLRCEAVVAQAHDLAQSFLALVRQRCPEQLDGWIHACAAEGAPELQNFAIGLRREEAAIRAALSTPWSTGPVEGHITRLKCIKRQMYGRANFDLLRLRVLHAA